MIPLALIIALVDSTRATPRHFILKVDFNNISKEPVRILKRFDEEQNLPIWFQLEMTTLDGTPVPDVRGGGKINLRGTLQYVTLQPGETFSLHVDVSRLVTDLRAGAYLVRMTYRNQYGENCFQGELKSNNLKVTIAPAGP